MGFCTNKTRKKIIIAVDGFSGCGKSTFARLISTRIGYIFIDTGSMYRAVTLYAIENGMVKDGFVDEAGLIGKLPEVQISFVLNPETGSSDIYLNGRNVEKEIRCIDVSAMVSRISRIAEVRRLLVGLQQKMGEDKGIVMDGRDIGTVVFPHAELKIFMTADTDVRAMRRYKELSEKGHKVSLAEIRKNLEERDYADQHREISPLRKAYDALLLDNSNMSIAEQMSWVMGIIDKLTCSEIKRP